MKAGRTPSTHARVALGALSLVTVLAVTWLALPDAASSGRSAPRDVVVTHASPRAPALLASGPEQAARAVDVSLLGHVVDADGLDVPGAGIRVLSTERRDAQPPRVIARGATGIEGSFALDVEPGAYRVEARDRLGRIARADVSVAAGVTARPLLMLGTGAFLDVLVTDADARPVPRVRVRVREDGARAQDAVRTEWTGADGRALVEVEPGTWQVHVDGRDGGASASTVTVTDVDGVLRVPVRWRDHAPTTGHVLLEDGRPCVGATVFAEPLVAGSGASPAETLPETVSARTRAGGRFVFEQLLRGVRYRIRVQRTRAEGARAASGVADAVLAGTSDVLLRLARGKVAPLVHLRVVEAETGRPVTAYTVRAVSTDGQSTHQVTDPDGRADLPVSIARTSMLRVQADAYVAASVEIAIRDVARLHEVVLAPAGHVRVLAVDDHGVPVQGLLVSASPVGLDDPSQSLVGRMAVVGADGVALLDLSRGTWHVHATDPSRGVAARRASSLETVDVTTHATCDVVLPVEVRVGRGSLVVDLASDTWLGKTTVSLSRIDGRDERSVVTDAAGHAVVDGLPAGLWKVGLGQRSTHVEIRAGEVARLVVEVP